jgi:type IV secretion system protein VirD4
MRKLKLNPFGAIVEAYERSDKALGMIIRKTMRVCIDEPPNDQKQAYWRENPRALIELCVRGLLLSSTGLCTPGAVYLVLSETELIDGMIALCEDEGDAATRSIASQVRSCRDADPNYGQHIQAALQVLKPYEPGSPLHHAGENANCTFREVLETGLIVCVVNPVEYADTLGIHFGLLSLGFLQAQLALRNARTLYVYDELANAPLRDAVKRITIMRAFGATGLYITQSRKDLINTYGEKETAVLEENAVIKQYLKFSSFEEAERVSRAIGEQLSVQKGLGTQSGRLDLSGNYSVGKERIFTADELMRLPPDEQILHVAGVGWIHAKKARQNQIMPYAAELGDNPLEGAAMVPNPKITLLTPEQMHGNARRSGQAHTGAKRAGWARFWPGGAS